MARGKREASRGGLTEFEGQGAGGMVEMVMAREALNSIVAEGRTIREAAGFLSEQCFELRLHAWAYVNTYELQQVPHEIWCLLAFAALPDENGIVDHQSENVSIVGNWLEGRISYWLKPGCALPQRYNIQGMRFDVLEVKSVRSMARQWSSEPIGALPLLEASSPARQSETSLAARAPGRPRGTGYRDGPYVEEALQLLTADLAKSVTEAVNLVVARYVEEIGGASYGAKVARLRRKTAEKWGEFCAINRL